MCFYWCFHSFSLNMCSNKDICDVKVHVTCDHHLAHLRYMWCMATMYAICTSHDMMVENIKSVKEVILIVHTWWLRCEVMGVESYLGICHMWIPSRTTLQILLKFVFISWSNLRHDSARISKKGTNLIEWMSSKLWTRVGKMGFSFWHPRHWSGVNVNECPIDWMDEQRSYEHMLGIIVAGWIHYKFVHSECYECLIDWMDE